MLTRDKVLHDALQLSPIERRQLVREIEGSLALESNDDIVAEPVASDTFHVELLRRSEAWRTGTSRSRPMTEVMRDLELRQSEGR